MTIAGWATIVAAVAGLVFGLILVGSLTSTLTASIEVSQTALEAIGDTIDVVGDAVGSIDETLGAASDSVSSASATADAAAIGLQSIVFFLEDDLPDTIDSIHEAMPAAIQTAGVIDTTLQALSFFGVDYDPSEPFQDSLRRVDRALAPLAGDLRVQALVIGQLAPSAQELADDTGDLAGALADLRADLADLEGLTVDYQATIAAANAAMARTAGSWERNVWLLRGLVVAAAAAIALLGGALVALANNVSLLPYSAAEDD